MTTQRSVTFRLDPDGPDQRPQWLRALEKTAEHLHQEDPDTYGSLQHGATVGQTWHTMSSLFGVPMVCVLVEGRPAVGAENVPTVVTVPWPRLLPRLRHMVGESGKGGIVSFVYDGRTGHTVTVTGHEDGRFVYHDPWPGDSLLCRHQNAAGIDAQEHGDHAWTVTEDELSRVLVAALVWPSNWAEACGAPAALRYGELRRSEFWSFFGIHERHGPGTHENAGTREDAGAHPDPAAHPDRAAHPGPAPARYAGGETGADAEADADDQRAAPDAGERTVTLATGGFTDQIGITLRCDARDRIVRATLRIREDWALGPPWGLNPFALDLVRSFLGALTPEADRPAAEPALPPLSPPDAVALLQDDTKGDVPGRRLLAAYVGAVPDVRLRYAMSAAQVSRPDEGWIQIEITTF